MRRSYQRRLASVSQMLSTCCIGASSKVRASFVYASLTVSASLRAVRVAETQTHARATLIGADHNRHVDQRLGERVARRRIP